MEGEVIRAEKLGSPSCSSLSTDSSSDDYLFQVDPIELSISEAHASSLCHNNQQSSQVNQPDVSTGRSWKSEEGDNSYQDLTPTSPFFDISPTENPPFQVMDRSEGYDPYRIPASIFERSKSSAPLEWSVASNESLFSIHVGNYSFSRDLFSPGDLGKSGELTKSGELVMLSPAPSIQELESNETIPTRVEMHESGATLDETSEKDSIVSGDRKGTPSPVVTWNSSVRSDESGVSVHSFAFPINRKKTVRPLCYCSNCSRPFCYYRWPRWYCPKCSWACCYGWNYSHKAWSSHSSAILTEDEQSVSAKAEVETQQSQKGVSSNISCSLCKCWFTCFSWFSLGRCCRCCSRSVL